ncbi:MULTISPECIES: WD40 repeat domain-containing protein [Trichocoleus]|uniref:WD40 repeat domain-containing protein n=1 Tax=Trichocoleus desertorum GB2-A4 TaxID=2933944 RepID=A0ABV0JH01_9CYAN|nr:hypothetical protein [Trichocoleus sp. FACHB-46]MBD1865508.1 hypothetical protein [Trichocoleus sp. FACHB-46]
MKSTIALAWVSGVVSCAIASSAPAQQIPNAVPRATPNSTKSWERPTLRVSLPTSATQLEFSADGETLLTDGATKQSAELWSLKTGQRISTFPAKAGFAFCDIALSPDGQFAAGLLESRAAPKVQAKRQIELNVWDLKTGKSQWTRPIQDHPLQTPPVPGQMQPPDIAVCQVEFSPNSRVLATSISSRSNKLQSGVRIWNVPQGTLQQVTGSPVTYIDRLAFSPDSAVVGFTTLANSNSQLHLWNLKTRKLQAKLQARYEGNLLSIVDIVFSPNQPDVIAFANDGIFSYLHHWQTKTGKFQRLSRLSIDRTANLLALSPDGQTYVYGSDVIGYYISNFQTHQSWEFPPALKYKSGPTRVVFSRDGQQMAIVIDNQTIQVIR